MQLNRLIAKFVDGDDTSLEQAGAIEVALDDQYPDDDFIQQTVEMLAMYKPGGGDFLFETDAIKKRLIETINYLQSAKSGLN